MSAAKAKTMDGSPPVMTLMEAAERLRIGRTTMQKLVREKKVRSFKIGPRSLRIHVDSIDELVRKLEREGKKL
jgi:excisionase family DNA binding protein